jgi:hypothetical protein
MKLTNFQVDNNLARHPSESVSWQGDTNERDDVEIIGSRTCPTRAWDAALEQMRLVAVKRSWANPDLDDYRPILGSIPEGYPGGPLHGSIPIYRRPRFLSW